MVRYDYDSLDEFISDRSFESHIGLKAANSELLFGQILRNIMKHAFECGVVYQGGDKPDGKYE